MNEKRLNFDPAASRSTAPSFSSDVSEATRRNWLRLRPNCDEKLTSRANKRASSKFVLPLEYFANRENVPFVRELTQVVRANGWTVEDVLFSVAANLLKKNGLRRKTSVKRVLDERAAASRPIGALEKIEFPDDEPDWLGLIYQTLLSEGAKNRTGSYYTPRSVAVETTRTFDFSSGATFFDPCCGSGAFLLAAIERGADPEFLWGVDSDPNAVFAAKINLIRRFPKKIFAPKIVCGDFLRDSNVFGPDSDALRFDFIATNPPWGAVAKPLKRRETDRKRDDRSTLISSNETFSLFFVRAFERLKDGGRIRFLLPESVLNVKTHRDLRTFLLERCRIVSIARYPNAFSGVSTKFIDLDVRRAFPAPTTVFRCGSVEKTVETAAFFETKNRVFRPVDADELAVLRQMKRIGKYSLRESFWALGIVTGDNKNALADRPDVGLEPIFTGREVAPFVLNAPRKFLRFDRSRLQQAAKEELYRAPEKLAYKFVSNRLVFAFDDSRGLFLNSANILIPRVPGTSAKSAAAFLNSELFQFFYSKLFGEIKILQGNLCELPFPILSSERDARISALVDSIRAGNRTAFEPLQREIFDVFQLSSAQIRLVRER